jgi:threonine dehydratase
MTRIELKDVQQAAERLRTVAVRTPLLESPDLNQCVGGRVLLKPECMQVTGSFKIRGAYNLMCRLPRDDVAAGVVAWSSGNHAQGVAAAGALLGMQTAIVMPEDAPQAKIHNTRRLGGETVLYDRYTGDREAIAKALAAERGSAIVPSYDHADIIAGQGTVGLEIMQQCNEMGVTPDHVLLSCSGGGLSAGCAIAIKALSQSTTVHTVEPAEFDDTARSLATGKAQRNAPGSRSICDALQAESPGEITFPIMRELMGEGLRVSDADVAQAIRFGFRSLKLVLEPGGAAALAALLADKIESRDKLTVVVLSGGNIDAPLFAAIQNGEV